MIKMRGMCIKCKRNTVLKKDGLCQSCWVKGDRKGKIKLKIKNNCIFCGWERTWKAYKSNWKCGKCQFEHKSMEEFGGKDYLIESD